jgi:hypothetical protein
MFPEAVDISPVCVVLQVLRRFLGLAGEERQSMLNLLTGTTAILFYDSLTIHPGRRTNFSSLFGNLKPMYANKQFILKPRRPSN